MRGYIDNISINYNSLGVTECFSGKEKKNGFFFSLIPPSSLNLITKFKNDDILKRDLVGSYNL